MAALQQRPDAWIDFMMRFELGLERPDAGRAVRRAATIAVAYIVGGLVPLAPYFVASSVSRALPWSVAITLVALAVFGWIKGLFTGTPPVRSAAQTLVVGGLAASVAFLLARAFG